MKVKVISCGEPSWWYANKIGQVFEVVQSIYSEDDWLYTPEAAAFSKDDCEVVTESTTNQVLSSQVSPSQVGNIDSNEKGSGARYNSGKPDYSMLLLSDLSEYLANNYSSDYQDELNVIFWLGQFQKTHDPQNLNKVLETLGMKDIEESTHVFVYGAKKYKAWNWAKGMQWSVPLACAVRHTLSILNGEDVDAESGRKHRGHILCNVFMLIHYTQYYKEGNDLPPKELFEDSYD